MDLEGARTFRILGRLGRGRYGALYLGRPMGSTFAQDVVLELIEGADPSWIEAAADRAKRIRRADEPVLLVEEPPAYLGGERWALVRERFEGCPVDRLLDEGIALPVVLAVAIVGQVARGITRSGLSHGELDASVIHISAGGDIRLEGIGTRTDVPPSRDVRDLGYLLERLLDGGPPRDPLRRVAADLAAQMRSGEVALREVFGRCRAIAEQGPPIPLAELGAQIAPLAATEVELDALTGSDFEELEPPPAVIEGDTLPFPEDDPSFAEAAAPVGELETEPRPVAEEETWLRDEEEASFEPEPAGPPTEPDAAYSLPAYLDTLDPPTGAASTPPPTPRAAAPARPAPRSGGGSIARVLSALTTALAAGLGLFLGLGVVVVGVVWWSMSPPRPPSEVVAPPGDRVSAAVGQSVLCTFAEGTVVPETEGVTALRLDARTWLLRADLPAAIRIAVDEPGAAFTLDASPVATEADLDRCTRAPLDPVKVPKGAEVSVPVGFVPTTMLIAEPDIASLGPGKIPRSLSVDATSRGATSIAAADRQGNLWVRTLVVD